MRRLSISAAWDETRAVLTHDGSLLITVALALIALPAAVSNFINPAGVNAGTASWSADLISFVCSVIALAGQLSLIRLAIGPSITVGAAITHGLRRMPIYFVAVLILVIASFILAVPFVFLLGVLGVPLNVRPVPMTAPVILLSLLFLAIILYFGVRFLLSSAVASAEDVGPIGLLKRSWRLTAGQWWPLFGFMLVFLIAALVLLIAVGSAVGSVVVLLMGPVQAMSAAALIIALVQSLFSAAVTTLFAVMLARIYLQLTGNNAQASVPSSGI
jgi:hypothetical protein